MNIFVAKLSYGTEESSLREAFEAYGEVDSVKIVMDRETGRSKGFGFVEMPDSSEGEFAISQLNDTDIDGRTIVVKEAEARPQRSNNRFDRNSGGGYNRR